MKVQALKNMIDNGNDSSTLRFGLGNHFYKSGNYEEAITHLNKAIEIDPTYSAAWKILGKSLSELGDTDQAIMTFQKGKNIAEQKGDIQAVKEINVFLKRLQKSLTEI